MFGSYSIDNNQTDDQSGFEERQDGVLDHLADVDDRAEVDLFDNGVPHHHQTKVYSAHEPAPCSLCNPLLIFCRF